MRATFRSARKNVATPASGPDGPAPEPGPVTGFLMFSGNLGSTITFSNMPSALSSSENMSCFGTRTKGVSFSLSMCLSM